MLLEKVKRKQEHVFSYHLSASVLKNEWKYTFLRIYVEMSYSQYHLFMTRPWIGLNGYRKWMNEYWLSQSSIIIINALSLRVKVEDEA